MTELEWNESAWTDDLVLSFGAEVAQLRQRLEWMRDHQGGEEALTPSEVAQFCLDLLDEFAEGMSPAFALMGAMNKHDDQESEAPPWWYMRRVNVPDTTEED